MIRTSLTLAILLTGLCISAAEENSTRTERVAEVVKRASTSLNDTLDSVTRTTTEWKEKGMKVSEERLNELKEQWSKTRSNVKEMSGQWLDSANIVLDSAVAPWKDTERKLRKSNAKATQSDVKKEIRATRATTRPERRKGVDGQQEARRKAFDALSTD